MRRRRGVYTTRKRARRRAALSALFIPPAILFMCVFTALADLLLLPRSPPVLPCSFHFSLILSCSSCSLLLLPFLPFLSYSLPVLLLLLSCSHPAPPVFLRSSPAPLILPCSSRSSPPLPFLLCSSHFSPARQPFLPFLFSSSLVPFLSRSSPAPLPLQILGLNAEAKREEEQTDLPADHPVLHGRLISVGAV